MSAVNLPNSITLTRIFSIPLLIWILSTSRFHGTGGEKELLASALFIAASITDGIDGYLARKRGQITTIGMLLDPLADKLLIAAAFVTLVQFNPSLVPAWVAVVIIAREFLVSGLRSIAASEGFTIEASDLGKFKMLVQIVSVVAVILDHRWKAWYVGRYIFPTAAVYRTVAETARAAAFEDSRFWPVTPDEAPELEVSLSILSQLKPIRAEEVEIGKHGLLISMAGHRGLLLPQVPAEHGWDRITFLEQTCKKAGLPLNGWQTGAKLEAFTAEVFGDRDQPCL